MERIIEKFSDQDLYSWSVGLFYLNHFSELVLEYTFIDRNNTVYPEGFAKRLMREIWKLDGLNMTDEEITEELRKQFKMQGLILADSNIVRKMDTNLVSGSSNIVPAYIGKDGEVSDKQNTLNRKQFENLQNYMEKIIKQISEEILNGNIKPNKKAVIKAEDDKIVIN